MRYFLAIAFLAISFSKTNAQPTYYDVPVFVHIFGEESEINFPDATIENLIFQLNRKFASLDASLADIDPNFADVWAEDTGIQFTLAFIQRILTDGNLFDKAALSQINNGDPRGLNVWIKNTESGALLLECPIGMSSFSPYSTNCKNLEGEFAEGFWYDLSLIGSENPNFWIQGAAHWLGLFDLWYTPPLQTTPGQHETGDDDLHDTPPQDGPTSSCEFPAETNVHNFMDKPLICRNMFTELQETKMVCTILQRRGEFKIAPDPRRFRCACFPRDGLNINQCAQAFPNDDIGIGVSPNPMNPGTMISFELAESEQASIRVYSIDGRLVRTLLNSELNAGSHQIYWDGLGHSGSSLPSGMYIIDVMAGDKRFNRPVSMMK